MLGTYVDRFHARDLYMLPPTCDMYMHIGHDNMYLHT